MAGLCVQMGMLLACKSVQLHTQMYGMHTGAPAHWGSPWNGVVATPSVVRGNVLWKLPEARQIQCLVSILMFSVFFAASQMPNGQVKTQDTAYTGKCGECSRTNSD